MLCAIRWWQRTSRTCRRSGEAACICDRCCWAPAPSSALVSTFRQSRAGISVTVRICRKFAVSFERTVRSVAAPEPAETHRDTERCLAPILKAVMHHAHFLDLGTDGTESDRRHRADVQLPGVCRGGGRLLQGRPAGAHRSGRGGALPPRCARRHGRHQSRRQLLAGARQAYPIWMRSCS